MNNPDFFELFHEPREAGRPKWSVEKLAQAIGSNRASVSQILSNAPGRGGQTRRKLVGVLKREFVTWPAMLTVLGWNEDGSLRNPKPSQPSAFLLARGGCAPQAVNGNVP